MQTRKFQYQDKELHYRVKGDGPLVVLLHGFGEDGTIWQSQFDIFPEHRLVVPDLPGSGASEMIDDMSMEGLAEAVKALIEKETGPSIPQGGSSKAQGSLSGESAQNTTSLNSRVRSEASANPPLGGGGATLIGHSMGGYITLAFAEKYPALLRAFGLFHSSAFADSEEKKETRRKGIAFIEKNGAFEFLKTSTPNMYSPQTKERSPELVETHLASVRNFSAAALVNYYEAMIQRPDRTNVLRSSAVPVLFVMGRYDNAVLVEDGLKQCYLPALAHIHLLNASGHMGMREEIDETNRVLSAFIKF
ncbi:MAG TPA: alpha/beta hydrolase [Flavisolibacter sp.]|nr:alpha/beta hydrolase [Flavisolibacter sp.]